MQESTAHNTLINPKDYLVAALLDFYRSSKNARNFWHAAKLAESILARNSMFAASKLEKRFLYFANSLKDNINIESLRDFAEKCHKAATKTGAIKVSSEKKTLSMTALKKFAKAEINASLSQGHSEGAAINRAAYQLIRKQKEEAAKTRMEETINAHPLKETLEGLMVKDAHLAKEDIRNQLLRLRRPSSGKKSGEGVLFGVLAKAQAFSATRMHRLLGDELFFLCRPTGFLDQKGTCIVVEVPTSAHLHMLTYKKLEIIKALKADSAFSLVSKIQLKIKI